MAGALLAVGVSGAWERAERPGVWGEASSMTADAEGFGILQEARGAFAGSAATRLPDGFEDEVVRCAECADVRVDEHGGVVGFGVSESAADAFTMLSDELGGKGWSGVESGMEGCGSFMKGGGRYRWVFVSCVQVGDSTSVVVQYTMADERS